MIFRASVATAPVGTGTEVGTDGSWALKVKRTVQKYSVYFNWLWGGWRKKVALVACMRKLLGILNAMAKHRSNWNPAPNPAWLSKTVAPASPDTPAVKRSVARY